MASYTKHDPRTIQAMFNSIASRYDLTNSILSFKMHKKWNRELVHCVRCFQKFHTFLDLCCGTGDIALDYLKTSRVPCQAYLIDFCSEMLFHAKQKAERLPNNKHQIKYIEADIQKLPLKNASIDCATIAYGIRNIKDPLICLQEIHRVLKPGGCIGILELTQPSNRLLRIGHNIYLNTALPFLGKCLTSNQEAYDYLRKSIQTFIEPIYLEQLMITCKFKRTSIKPLFGGIATIWIGYKSP